MVYRGRPSTGCKRCRERRVKCDETPKSCQNCTKLRLQCPGYDRTVDAFFHDETAVTEVKAKKAKAKAIAARDAKYPVSTTSPASSTSTELVPSPVVAQDAYGYANDSPGVMLLAPLIDQGIAYFMSHYAIGMDQPSMHSNAYNKYLATHGFHPLVATSMTALGIAGVANLYRDSALKAKATKWYLDAIKMTNTALTHPKDVKSDTTLLAITLLGLIEATSNEHTLHAWGEHVAGAASLVKLRGMKQFSSPAGRRMYLHAIALLTMNCLADGVALPAYVQEMNEEIKKHSDTADPRTRFFFLQQDVVNLRAEILASPKMDLRSILVRALALDREAGRVFEHAGPEWGYDVVTTTQLDPCVYGSQYHIYPSHATAQTWNWVRYTRIYIHDIIRNALLAGLATSPPLFTSAQHLAQLAASIAALQSAQEDILASAPQFLHDVPSFKPQEDAYPTPFPSPGASPPASPPSTSTSSTTTTTHRAPFPAPHKNLTTNFRTALPPPSPSLSPSKTTHRLPIVRVSGGHSTLWALYIAGAMPTATRPAQEYVIRCLRRFEAEFGIMQAKVLAAALGVLMRGGEREEGVCVGYLPRMAGPYVLDGEGGR